VRLYKLKLCDIWRAGSPLQGLRFVGGVYFFLGDVLLEDLLRFG